MKLLYSIIFLFFFHSVFAQNPTVNRNGQEISVNSPATNTAQGQVKLAGDLGGTADLPTVPALINKVEGSGTLNYIPKFTAGKTLGNSLLFDNGTNVGVGTTSPANKLEINQGTAGNSGLRFTNLNSSSSATTSSSKVLGLNSTGDVILTNVPGTQNIIDFDINANPNTAGTTFSPNTPNDQSVVYQSIIDNSLWTYNGSTYVTYTAPASTAWFSSGTTNDAGSSKISNIYRTGNVGIGLNTPLNKLVVRGVNAAASANGTVQSNATFRVDGDTNHALDMGTLSATPFGSYIQSHNKTAAFGLALSLNPSGGNVGIGTSTPATTLQINNSLIATNTVNANAQVLRLSRPTTSNIKWDNIAQFNLGSYSTAIAANSRLDLALTNGLDASTLTNVMTWQANGNVGIGTSAPTGQLEVATNNGLSLMVRRGGPSSQTPANLILQKTWGADANTNTAVPNGELVGRIVFSAANGSSYPTNGTDIVGYAAGTQSGSNNGGGIIFRTVPQNNIEAAVERMRIDENGRVGIATVTPNTSSILDITSTDRGVLIPRMTSAQRTLITNPADALLVYDTDVKMFYYYNSATSSWSPINVGTVKSVTASYTLLLSDNGRVLDVNSASAVTITVPNTLPVGFQVSITQAGAGQVTITGGTGMTVNNRYAATRTSGQWAKAGLEVRASGSAVLSGDVQ
jgi:hypothetical protein